MFRIVRCDHKHVFKEVRAQKIIIVCVCDIGWNAGHVNGMSVIVGLLVLVLTVVLVIFPSVLAVFPGGAIRLALALAASRTSWCQEPGL